MSVKHNTGDEQIGAASTAELQALVDETARSLGVTGAQVSVIVDDKQKDFVYGTANSELNTPMTQDTVVQIGSLTKVINAAMIMALVDEGKLELDAPVSKYIPDLKLAGKSAPEDVTLRRLLSMSGGLDFGTYNGFKGDNAIGRYVAQLSDVPLVYPPGEGFGYSNAGPCIAAHAAEKVTGLPWDALIKKYVFDPAGLEHTASLPADIAYQRVAVGHSAIENGQPAQVLRPWVHNESLAPAGIGFAASAHELASFGKLFLNDGKAADGNRILSEEAVKAMMTPTTPVKMPVPHWGVGEKWGLGPTMAQWGDTKVWGSGGSTLGGASLLLWIPEKNAVVSFTVNTPVAFERFAARFTSDFTQALLGVRAPEELAAPAHPVQVDNPQRLVGNYVRDGDRIEITEQNGRLHYKQVNEALIGRLRQMNLDANQATLVDDDLVALGGDKFLVKFPGFENGISLFFSGKDVQGKATSITSGLRTSIREELAVAQMKDSEKLHPAEKSWVKETVQKNAGQATR